MLSLPTFQLFDSTSTIIRSYKELDQHLSFIPHAVSISFQPSIIPLSPPVLPQPIIHRSSTLSTAPTALALLLSHTTKHFEWGW